MKSCDVGNLGDDERQEFTDGCLMRAVMGNDVGNFGWQ
jgi:hypothetical protein